MAAAAIITVRMTSSRLPGKSLLPIFGDYTALGIVIDRAKGVGLPVIVATSDDQTDQPIADLAARRGVACFRGSRLNKIDRWLGCARAHGLDLLVMVDGDDLAFDPVIARRAVETMRSVEADRCTVPDDIVCGLFTAAYSRRAMEKLALTAPDPQTDTDVLDVFIGRAGLSSFEVPLEPEERGKTVRLTLDYPEDAEFFRKLYSILPTDASGATIVRTALETGIWEINYFRQQDYLDNQRRFSARVSCL